MKRNFFLSLSLLCSINTLYSGDWITTVARITLNVMTAVGGGMIAVKESMEKGNRPPLTSFPINNPHGGKATGLEGSSQVPLTEWEESIVRNGGVLPKDISTEGYGVVDPVSGLTVGSPEWKEAIAAAKKWQIESQKNLKRIEAEKFERYVEKNSPFERSFLERLFNSYKPQDLNNNKPNKTEGAPRKPNPDKDPRKDFQELTFPNPDDPNEYSKYCHIFCDKEGHVVEATKGAKAAMNRAFKEGTHLGQDVYGNHHIEWIHPETGDQFWLQVRPNGKIMDAGANAKGKHWGKSEKTGFLAKPHNTSPKGTKGGLRYGIAAMVATPALDACAEEAKTRVGLNDDQLTAWMQENLQKSMPEKTQKKMSDARKAAFQKSMEEEKALQDQLYENAKKYGNPLIKNPVNSILVKEKELVPDLAPPSRQVSPTPKTSYSWSDTDSRREEWNSITHSDGYSKEDVTGSKGTTFTKHTIRF